MHGWVAAMVAILLPFPGDGVGRGGTGRDAGLALWEVVGRFRTGWDGVGRQPEGS